MKISIWALFLYWVILLQEILLPEVCLAKNSPGQIIPLKDYLDEIRRPSYCRKIIALYCLNSYVVHI